MSARLRPSDAATWVACAGSLQLQELFPEAEDSPEAIEGQRAHHLATELARTGKLPTVDGEVTEEMVEGAELFAAAVHERLPAAHFEQRLDASVVHADCAGTPDAWGVNGSTRTLHVVDYKFGHGYVEEFENWQCIVYGLAAFEAFIRSTGGNRIAAEAGMTLEVTIVQPRCYTAAPVRSWRIGFQDLRPYLNQLQHAAVKALETDPPPKATTGSQCRYCRARHACTTLQEAAAHVVDMSGQAVAVDAEPLHVGGELRELHRAAKLLAARIDGLEAQAEALLRSGSSVPFYQLVPGESREKWRDESEVAALGELFGVELVKPKPVTPAQARKLIDATVISEYAVRPPGTLKVKPVDPNHTRKIFHVQQ